MRVALVLATAFALAASAAAAGGLGALSDDFGGATPAGWNMMNGDDFGDGTAHDVAVVDGALTVSPTRSWWVDDKEAWYAWKDVTGDFVATMRVRVSGTKTPDPQANWSLSGILVRDGRST